MTEPTVVTRGSDAPGTSPYAKDITHSRRKALEVLGSADDGAARYSNATSVEANSVYWSPADWLVEQGFAEKYVLDGVMLVALTELGRQLATDVLG